MPARFPLTVGPPTQVGLVSQTLIETVVTHQLIVGADGEQVPLVQNGRAVRISDRCPPDYSFMRSADFLVEHSATVIACLL